MAINERQRKAERMERCLRTYYEGCNEASVEKMMACFVPDAVHYFPPGMYGGPFQGAAEIARRWQEAMDSLGSYWTIDRLVIDPDTSCAVFEWTHFKTKQGVVLRGTEWAEFEEETGLMKEVRAYYAAPQDPSLQVLALGGFDYRGRGYAMAPPPGARG